jgi:hypothetical protein
MARVKLPEYQIAFVLGIGMKALRESYAPEMLMAAIEADLEVRETLLQMALSGQHVGATIFWAKAYGGFEKAREKEAKEPRNREVFGTLGPETMRVVGPNGERRAA